MNSLDLDGSVVDDLVGDDGLLNFLDDDDLMDLALADSDQDIINGGGESDSERRLIADNGTSSSVASAAVAAAAAAGENTSESLSSSDRTGQIRVEQEAPTASTPKQRRDNDRDKNRDKQKTQERPAAASSRPTEDFEYITTDQINKHDVLCGRGAGIKNNPGNENFRILVVARKDEYVSAKQRGRKNEIARSICRHVRTELDPPGRFLKRATEEQAAQWGFVGEEAAENVWVPVDEATMLARAMQSLREKDVKYVERIRKGEPPPAGAQKVSTSRKRTQAASAKRKSAATGTANATPELHIFTDHDLLSSSVSPDTFALDHTRTSTSVKDWISTEMVRAMSLYGSQVQEADRYYQLKAIRLAHALLETVQMYHQNGIAFGGTAISSGTIRVSSPDETRGEPEINSIAYMLDIVGGASQSHLSDDTFGDDVTTDLVNSGALLYELFSGIPPFQNQEDALLFSSLAAAVDADSDGNIDSPSTKKSKGWASASSVDSDVIPLRDLGLPASINALVSDLMNSRREDEEKRYKSATDVIADIEQMINDPSRNLFDIEDDNAADIACRFNRSGSRLEFPRGKLYGRDNDIVNILGIFESVVCNGGRTATAFVSGYSGIGKTSLVLQLRQPTIERGGFFISGKFDKLRQAKPLSAIAHALDAFCDDLASSQNAHADKFNSIKESICGAVGDGADVLVRIIPNLSKILRPGSRGGFSFSEKSEIDVKALNRLIFLFRRFFTAVATPAHPVVLFIDDLQWADQMSLNLIREIICASEMRSFMFVGSYRSNEVDQDHPLVDQISQIQAAGVTMLNIELSSMDKDSINALIADTLKLSPLLTRRLADAVYSKTSGNCLFVIELLSDLHRQNLLRYSVSSRRWEWDDDAITALEIKSNVVDLMRRKLLRLGATEMWSVKVAACLGAQTHALSLDLLSQGLGLTVESGLASLLTSSVEEGLLIKIGPSYRFSHDQIQQAAYSLVSTSDRPLFHLQLGRSLLKGAAANEGLENDVLFTCVDQLNRGSSEITKNSERKLVAQLNLQAAKSAIASSTFFAASIYLRFARGYLEEQDWHLNYHLCLEVHTALAETEYVGGAYEEMNEALNEVFSQARSFDDKLPAYYTLIRANSSQNHLGVAISTCFEVLEELGETFDEEEDPSLIMKECLRIKAMLEGKDKAWLMEQSVMTDQRMLNRMKYMHMMILYLYYASPLKLPLVACRMIDLSLQHGICKESAMAFSAHALVCCSFLGDYEGGYQVGSIATAIVEKFDARELVGRINVVHCACVNVWTQPLQSTLPLLEFGYDSAISSGDPEYALICTQVHTMTAFLCGQPLEGIVENLSRLTKECKHHHMDLVTAVIFPLWQCIENLIGDSEPDKDPTVLNGDIIQGDAYVEAQLGPNRKGNYKTSIFQYYFMRMMLAYTFGRDELAAEMYDKCMEFDPEKNARGRPTICSAAFYGALAALSMERREPKNPKWRGIVDAVMPKMERWTEASAWNCEHKLLFLRAEELVNAGSHREAVAAYEKAKQSAREHRFVNEEALVCQRYSMFLSEMGDGLSAGVQRTNAVEAYRRWGAFRKCKEMENEITRQP